MNKNNFFKKIRFPFFLILIVVGIGSSVLVATAGTSIYSFDSSDSGGVNPYGALTYVAGTDTFYGMTSAGGANGKGALFSLTAGLYTTLYSFGGVGGGEYPHGSLTYVDSENKLYGMTSAGGDNGRGVIFSYDLNVENPTPYTVMHSFDDSELTGGSTPYGSLTYDAGEGLLYGMTSLGGEANFGTLFSIDLAGTTYTRRLSLTTPELDFSNMGKYPLDSLVSNGSYLMGMASEGGQFGYGVLFRSNFSGRYDKLYDFDGSSSGTPRGSLILGPGGLYYGMTEAPATIFSYEPELGTFTSLYTFDSGIHPYGSLLFDGRNRFYGRADDGANGILFYIDNVNNTYGVLEDFTDTVISGTPPFGSLIYVGSENKLYGMAHTGGSNDFGVIYRTDLPSYPDAFSFASQTGVDQNATIPSNTVTMSGIATIARLTISACTSECFYILNSGEPASEPVNVVNGDTIGLTVSSGGCGTTNYGTADVGGVTASFTISTSGCGGGGEGDVTAPVVTFSMPNTGSSLTVPLTFSATDGVGVTGYKITETSTPPSSGWENSAPTEYTFSSYGTKTLYAWAKDAAGNVSAENSDTIVLTEDTPPPPPPSLPPSGGGGGGSGIKVITPVITIKEKPPVEVPVVEKTEDVAPKENIQKSTPVTLSVFDSPIKQQIQKSFTPQQVENIEISIRALIAGITTLGATIVLASVLFLNPLAQPEFILIPIRLWTLLLIALGFRKKPTPWGTVYDAITKQPIDPVRLSLIDLDGNEVSSSITDGSGRFGFNVEEGISKIVLEKTNYLFPSYVISRNNMRDELYEKPYFGDYVSYDPNEPIQKNIPIDPIDFETEAWAKKNGDLSVNYSKRELIAGQVFNTLFLTTFLIVAVSLIVYPEKYNVIIFMLYIVAFILRRHNNRVKKMGRMYDLYGKPLSHVVMKAYSAVDNTLIKTTKTNRAGRYYLNLPQGLYYIRVERQTTDGLYVPVYSSPELMIRNGNLNKVFNIAYSQ